MARVAIKGLSFMDFVAHPELTKKFIWTVADGLCEFSNHRHKILWLFVNLLNFLFTASETKRDY